MKPAAKELEAGPRRRRGNSDPAYRTLQNIFNCQTQPRSHFQHRTQIIAAKRIRAGPIQRKHSHHTRSSCQRHSQRRAQPAVFAGIVEIARFLVAPGNLLVSLEAPGSTL